MDGTAPTRQADALLRRGAYKEAISFYEKAIRADPHAGNVYNNLGVALHALGRYDQAIAALRRGIALRPDHAEGYSNLGNVLKSTGDHPAAITAYEQAIALQPGYFQAYNNMASALYQIGRYDDAIQAYGESIALSPRYATAYYNLANVLKVVGRYDEAIAAATRAVSLKPSSAQALNNLGVILREMHRLPEAADAFKQAIRLAPGFALAWSNLALARLAAGDAPAAIEAADQCLAIAPQDTQAFAFKSLALRECGQEAAALWFDYDALIQAEPVQVYDGFSSLTAYNRALAAHLASQPDLQHEPAGKATRGGMQSLDLARDPSDLVACLRRNIELAVGAYRKRVSPAAHNPFLRYAPNDCSQVMWTTVIKPGGFQLPHMHSDGWISGVYYVSVPDQTPDSGSLVFGQAPPDLTLSHNIHTRTVLPQEGMMLLFPSYMYHGTRPHKGQGLRISVAFDIVPQQVNS